MEAQKGLVKTLRKPTPPPSPADFTWGWKNGERKAVAKKFGAALRELLIEKGVSAPQATVAIFGTRKDSDGHVVPRNHGLFGNWLSGRSLPHRRTVTYLAHYFGVPLARLVTPHGSSKGNGHDTPAAIVAPPDASASATAPKKQHRVGALPPIDLLPRPPDAPKPVMEWKTYADDAHFVSLTISGVVQWDIALMLMSQLSPETMGAKPRASNEDH